MFWCLRSGPLVVVVLISVCVSMWQHVVTGGVVAREGSEFITMHHSCDAGTILLVFEISPIRP